MLQIKVIQGADIEAEANEFLATIDSEAVKNISIDDTGTIAVIQYEVQEGWKNEHCYDCKYWDDGGDPEALSGMCVECGGRKRFNCRACKSFKDMRG